MKPRPPSNGRAGLAAQFRAASLVGVDEQPTDEEIRVFALAAIK